MDTNTTKIDRKAIRVEDKDLSWREVIEIAQEFGYKGKGAALDNQAKAGAVHFLRSRGYTVKLI